jgi:integrase
LQMLAGREINNFRFYDLRHTFITNMRKAGVDHSVIMRLTGHKTPSMFQRYNTVDIEDAQGAFQKLEELWVKNRGGKPPGQRCAPLVLPGAETPEHEMITG